MHRSALTLTLTPTRAATGLALTGMLVTSLAGTANADGSADRVTAVENPVIFSTRVSPTSVVLGVHLGRSVRLTATTPCRPTPPRSSARWGPESSARRPPWSHRRR